MIAAPDFDSLIARGWDEHAAQPAAVAARLAGEVPALVDDESRLIALARLAHHVHGEHLAQWAQGVAFQQRLAMLPAHRADGESGAAVRRHIAALNLAAGGDAVDAVDGVDAPGDAAALTRSDRVRVGAMAAASLVMHDTPRSMALFTQAMADFDSAALPDTDPAVRALAVTGNNLAAELEERPQRSADESALMLLAAQAGRRFWALAGGWLETGRAEYRLSNSWRVHGDAAMARQHAAACLAIVAANGNAPLELFFGWEALALAEAAAGDADAARAAAARGRQAFDALPADDQTWCRATLDRLPGGGPAEAPH